MRFSAWWHRAWQDVCGVASVVVMALAYLSPGLKDGLSFGPYDAGSNGTIGHPGSPAEVATYNRVSGDIINQGIPWNSLDRLLIHAGHLPLWNSYNGLGLPQLFNFESAAFSLPDIVSYGVPLRYAWTVVILMKLLIAGTGAYALARVLGARPLAASFGGITFMLSGGFAAWLGWSLTGVVDFAPWIVCFIVLSYRERRRLWQVLLAISVMFAFFGGFPEMYALLGGALVIFVVSGALFLLATKRRVQLAGCARTVFALCCGTLLAMPLLLPGEQLIKLSTHAAGPGKPSGRPISFASLFLAPGYYGLPTHGSVSFPSTNFYESVTYVGAIAIALALAGLFLARRQAAVVALGVFTVVCFVASYKFGNFSPAGQLLADVGLGTVHANRARLLVGFGIAVLGAVGLEQILRRPSRQVRLAWLASALVGAGLVVVLVVSSATEHLSGLQGTERFDSLIWPCGLAVALVISAAVVLVAGRRGSLSRAVSVPLGLGLVALQAAFLLFAGVGLNSWSSTGFVQYPGVTELKQIVGSGLVGLDGAFPGSPKVWPRLGFYPNLNIAYRVAEFATHDPLVPAAFTRTFPVLPKSGHGKASLSALDMPDISSAAMAREYGISYLLVQPGHPVPSGTKLVATISGERLVKVTGSERFSFAGTSGADKGTVTSWSQPVDNRWVIHVRAPAAGASSRVLVLRLTDVPGFRASDGSRSLAVRPYGAFEMAVTVPPGTSTVTVTYWPRRFTYGLVLGALGVVALAIWCLLGLFRLGLFRRRGGAHRRRTAEASA